MIQMSRKGIIVYYLCLVLLAIGLYGNRHRDGISKEYYNYPDYPELNNIAVNGEYQNAYTAGESYAGLVTFGPDLTLPRGAYKVSFQYRSEAEEGNRFEIVSDTEVNSENGLGCIYYRDGLPLNEDGRYSAEFVLEREAEHVQIKTYTAEGDLYVYGYTLKSTGPVNQDTWAMIAVLLCVFLLFHFFCIRIGQPADGGIWFEITDVNRLGVILAVVLVGLIASLPSFTDFVTKGHDLDYHLTRIEGLKEALLCGQFPVRINPEYMNGHGQASPIMYPELFLYFPAILRILGVSLIMSWQLLCTTLNLACAWAGYISFKKLSGSRTLGVLMSAFYTLSLYRMNNLYMRAALGEWIGMVFVPLVVYGMYALFFEEKEKWGWSVLAFTLCLQGHLLITEMAIAFSALFALFCFKQLRDRERLLTVIKAGAVTVLINLWYIIPLLYLYRQPLGITAEQQPLGQYALYPGQMFTTFLYNGNMGEYLGSTAGENPSTVGGILGIGILLYLYAAYVKKSLDQKEKSVGNMLLAFGCISLYMSSYYFPWDLLQKVRLLDILAGILQFPMRILSVTSIFLSAVCALGVYGILKDKISRRGIALAGVLLAIGAASYTLDSYVEENKTALADDTDSYNKNLVYNGLFYYQGTDINALLNRPPMVMASAEEVAVTRFAKRGTTVQVSYENVSNSEGYLELPLYYYPGYKAVINGLQTEVTAGENGVARVYVEANSAGDIKVMYREMGLFLIGDVISAVTLLGLAGYSCFSRRSKG